MYLYKFLTGTIRERVLTFVKQAVLTKFTWLLSVDNFIYLKSDFWIHLNCLNDTYITKLSVSLSQNI